jgi:hypothetical protein
MQPLKPPTFTEAAIRWWAENLVAVVVPLTLVVSVGVMVAAFWCFAARPL